MDRSVFGRSMQRHYWITLVLGLALFVAGCGGKTSATNSAGSQTDPSGSQLNSGPKAIETVSINPGLADWGAKVFKTRACVTCHAIGERKQGPDLAGVATRRTEAWMTKQIVDPEWMVKNDPISRQLFAEYALQMANQQVPEQEVKALIQFLVRESQKTAGSSASAGK